MQVSVDLKYQNYIFDLYGTLIDIHTEEGERKLWFGSVKPSSAALVCAAFCCSNLPLFAPPIRKPPVGVMSLS